MTEVIMEKEIGKRFECHDRVKIKDIDSFTGDIVWDKGTIVETNPSDFCRVKCDSWKNNPPPTPDYEPGSWFHCAQLTKLKPKKRTRKEVRTLWVNAYPGHSDNFYLTEQSADSYSMPHRLGPAIKVEYTVEIPEGE